MSTQQNLYVFTKDIVDRFTKNGFQTMGVYTDDWGLSPERAALSALAVSKAIGFKVTIIPDGEFAVVMSVWGVI